MEMETIKTYKLLRKKEDGVHSLYIDAEKPLPLGEWITAQAPSRHALEYIPQGYALIDMRTQCPVALQSEPPTAAQIISEQHRQCRWVKIIKDHQRETNYFDIGLTPEGMPICIGHNPGWHSWAEPTRTNDDMTDTVWAECQVRKDEYQAKPTRTRQADGTRKRIDWIISEHILIERIIDSI